MADPEQRYEPLDFRYDAGRDELVIEGVRYAAGYFRALAQAEPGQILEILTVEDGRLTVRRRYDIEQRDRARRRPLLKPGQPVIVTETGERGHVTKVVDEVFYYVELERDEPLVTFRRERDLAIPDPDQGG